MPSASATSPIKTVVVLVQENRSFDHMLGWMKSINPEIDGVTGKEWNPLSTSDPNSGRVYFGNNSEYVNPDPGHSFQAVREQIFGVNAEIPSDFSGDPPMNGFAQQAESEQKNMSQTVMNGFKPEAVPIYKSLVSEFAVFDRWFASVPASTQPNRLYVHSATSHGAMSNDSKKLLQGFPQKTIFESLDEAGYTFRIYYQYPPSTFFYKNLRKLKYVGNFRPFDLEFKRDCEQGKLANYVVIEQRWFDLKILHGNDDHPSHDVSEGQRFVKEVYEALRKSPQWNEMVFIITYDEHGGFYDHVPTPIRGVPNPDGLIGGEPYNFKFDRLGVRVPAIVISPWIEKGTVTLHEPQKTQKSKPNEHAKLSEFQGDLVQLAAQLNGDHHKDAYPDEMVENMTVKEAAKYVQDALATFLGACEEARKNGMDESEIVLLSLLKEPTSKSFFHKWFSCLACNTSQQS
ncbi:non-specific phospholipase C4 isoform X2 [Amborella trichopoda]|uniref:non-specific phospholipase C4 isoform X2 n=1 Tax=Amborella trichopoda TaxID=13333 RepID=UPI0005D3564D|nr:non-specific phospholipase C4 isoform X2 [Amborella trichopoda]|eukprot:XP_011621515.1 non-specific phospholipase C4 isoform X2 [Amborella trichopoda]